MSESNGADQTGDPTRKRTTPAIKRAWKQTLEEQELIAKERRSEDWEVTSVRANHTDPVSRDMGDHDRFGLFHVVPKSDGKAFVEAYDEEEFTKFLVYGSRVDQRRFGVTELIDPDGERSITISHEFPMERTRGLLENAKEAGGLHTYVRKIDGTILGSFRHDPFEPLLGIEDE